MPHNYTTDQYEGMIAETITIKGANGDAINTYFARPLGDGPFPAMVLIHHLPGWDELYRDFARKFAHHGYLAISPDLYHRFGHGTPDDVAAQARAEGGAPDDQVVADMSAAADYIRSLPYSNGKVGVFGTCSGGRHAFLCACRSTSFDAAVECWGGRVVQGADDLTPQQPVAPIDYTADLSCSLLGLFGAEDASPTPAEVDQHEQALKDSGKDYEFHMYEGAGHGFFYYDRGAYRQEQAVDGWNKLFDFIGKHLS